MPMGQVIQLKHKVTDYPDLRKAADLPAEFFRETSALTDADAAPYALFPGAF
jgi:hypothetical protein